VLAAMNEKKRSRASHKEAATEGPPALSKLPEDTPALSVELSPARAQLLRSLQETNERCIEMLVHAARAQAKDTFPLVSHLRSLLRGLAPDVRARAARTSLLLVDVQLSNAAFWTHLQAHPARPAFLLAGRGSFPRASAVPLGRATLMLAWHGVRSDPVGSCLLGINPEVARIIACFSLTELDRAVERRFRFVRPRWEDRPAIWRALLLSAQSGDARRTHEVNLRAIQLMTGDLLASRTALH
jgi:hypothetical protein